MWWAVSNIKYENFVICDDGGSVDVLKGNVGGGVGIGAGGVKAKVEAGVDLVGANVKMGENQVSCLVYCKISLVTGTIGYSDTG